MRKNIPIAILVVWIVVIFILTGYPSLKTPHVKEFPFDKLYHFALFFVLGILEYRILKNYLFFVFGCTIAVCAELQQLIIPGRDFEVFDIIAGLIGLFLSFVIFRRRDLLKDEISKA
jgi:VanZ family protein